VDKNKNIRKTNGILEIQSDRSSVNILVIPTDEELEIAEQTVEKIKSISKK
jgi:acetate kinase